MRSLLRLWGASRKFQIGVVIIVVLALLAIFHAPLTPLLSDGADPLAVGESTPWQTPNGGHFLGTEKYGRDVLIMTLVGLGISLKVAVIAGLLSTLIGVVVAFVAGYKGGVFDGILNTTTDMFLVVPSFPLLLTLSAYLKRLSLVDVSILLAAFSWPFAARTIRSQVLSLRSRPYVDLARINNQSALEIIFRDLVPNMLPYIGVGFATSALGAIFALVGLEVIGLGPASVIDLGMMINFAIGWGALSLGAWPLFIAPVAILSVLFIAVNLINIGLEEVYNPRLRGTAGA